MSARFATTSMRAPRPRPRLRRTALRTIACSAAVVLTAAVLGPVRHESPAPAEANGIELAAAPGNPPTPRDFTGYGFDQCLTPTQKTMNTWYQHSPFQSVGIYISGNSRHCRNQPNLTPLWVTTQLNRGWQLLPITLGPQASCSTRYPKYKDDPTISANNANGYAAARAQGKLEAERAVAAAKKLGIVPKSTLFYDLEAFDIGNAKCKASALRFVSAWTTRLRQLDYKSGFYSSAGSGIKMLDWAKTNYPTTFDYPDTLWIARWDGKANTEIDPQYLARTAWPAARVKQYQGGHNETWGGVTINIDRNYLDLGKGSVATGESHCNGTIVNVAKFRALLMPTADYTPPVSWVRALQCLLKEAGHYTGPLNGIYNAATRKGTYSWQRHTGFANNTTWAIRDWVSLTSAGAKPVLKLGSTGPAVYRAQRALRAALPGRTVAVNGVFDAAMAQHTAAYRKNVGLASYGIFNTATWNRAQMGKY